MNVKFVFQEKNMPRAVIKKKKKFKGGANKSFMRIGAPEVLTKNTPHIKKDGSQEKKLSKIIKTVFNKRKGK